MIGASRVPLEHVIITAELGRRPSRSPDYEGESRALAMLMEVMADRPGADSILQKLVETALELCRAHSAGISILEKENEREVFRWRAVAGPWSIYRGEAVPRESPCGTVLDRNSALLMRYPERHYTYAQNITLPIAEALLIPLHVGGEPVGTIWIISHDETRRFDAEDHRLMTSLGRFAANAYQLLNQERLATELAAVQQLLIERSLTEDHFRLAVEAAPSGMVLADSDGRIVLVNGPAEKLFGYRRDELVGRKVEMLVPERFRGTHLRFRSGYAAQPSARPLGTGRDLFALRKDGTEVPVEIGLSPFTTDQGTMVLSAVVDITERKRSEQARETLSRELQHRSNNLLAVIQAIAQRSLSGTDSLAQAKARFEARLHALARAHRRLTSSNWTGVGLGDIVRSELEPLAAHAKIEGPDVTLAPQQAQNFSLAVHELATNAVKHGALSSPAGEVSVSWRVARSGGDNVLKFQWRERGGPVVVAPARQGFGTFLLKATFGGARFDYAPEGFSCEIDFPVSKFETAAVDPPEF
ncbi:MAG: PAS domain S-box protein [Xanthobacteraceae bacterium]